MKTTTNKEGREEIKHSCHPAHEWCDPINEAGILYRTQYLVLSRTLLEAMPKEWQHRFIAIMDEVGEEFDFMHPDWVTPEYVVNCKGKRGMFETDPFGKYRYPNTEFINKFRKSSPTTREK